MHQTIETAWDNYKSRPTWKKAVLFLVPIGIVLAAVAWFIWTRFGGQIGAIASRLADRSKSGADRALKEYEEQIEEIERERELVDAEMRAREADRNEIFEEIDRANTSDDLLVIAESLRRRAERAEKSLDDTTAGRPSAGKKGRK